MRRFLLFTVLLFVFSVEVFSQKVIIPYKPRLIVGIVVEGLNYELLNRYWDKFGDDGFKKIFRRGCYYNNARYEYLNVNSASGYAVLSTGAYPNVNGIIDFQWFDRFSKNEVSCVKDEKYKIIGSDLEKTGFSPSKLLVPTWTDILSIENFKQSKIISISFDAYSAVLSGGKQPTGVFWFDSSSGNWVSSSYYCDSLPQWVKKFNNKHIAEIYLQKTWETTYAISEYKESLADANSFEIGIKGQTVFPYVLPELNKNSVDYSLLAYTPFANTFTKDFAITALLYEQLGKHDNTDVLLISFSATKKIAGKFGIRSVELEDAYIKLDKDIAHLLKVLEEKVGFSRFLLYLTSDKGSCDNPLWLKQLGFDMHYFTPVKTLVVLNSYLRAIYGYKSWVEYVSPDGIYLNQQEIDKAKISYREIETRVSEFLPDIEAVSFAVPAVSILNGGLNGDFAKLFVNSYCPERSGDVIFMLKPYSWLKINSTVPLADCRSSWAENTHVPLFLYGWKLSPAMIHRQVSMSALAQTIALILGFDLPQANGNLLYEILPQ